MLRLFHQLQEITRLIYSFGSLEESAQAARFIDDQNAKCPQSPNGHFTVNMFRKRISWNQTSGLLESVFGESKPPRVITISPQSLSADGPVKLMAKQSLTVFQIFCACRFRVLVKLLTVREPSILFVLAIEPFTDDANIDVKGLLYLNDFSMPG